MHQQAGLFKGGKMKPFRKNVALAIDGGGIEA